MGMAAGVFTDEGCDVVSRPDSEVSQLSQLCPSDKRITGQAFTA
jgi:hypothetical protein